MDYPAMSGLTMNHIHNKSSTCNLLEMFGLVHTCRVLPNMYTGESADASESIRNAVHLLHDFIRLSMRMHLSSDLFKPTKYLENVSKSSKSSWTKFQDGEGRYVWDKRFIQSIGEYVILYVKNVFTGQATVGYAACFHLCKILPLQCRTWPSQEWVIPDLQEGCLDPFQPLTTDTFSPEAGRVQIQPCLQVFLSFCPCLVWRWDFFFWSSCLSSCRVQAPDAGLGFCPKEQAMRQHLMNIQVLH